MGDIRILLVDDNAELRRSIKEFIVWQDGLSVVGECGNGVEALETISRVAVDVIVLDIIMPQMDGYTFLEEMSRLLADHLAQSGGSAELQQVRRILDELSGESR